MSHRSAGFAILRHFIIESCVNHRSVGFAILRHPRSAGFAILRQSQ